MAAEFRGTFDIVLVDFNNKKIVIGSRNSGSITPTYTYTLVEGTNALGVSTKVPQGNDFLFASYDTNIIKKGNKSGAPGQITTSWTMKPYLNGFGQL